MSDALIRLLRQFTPEGGVDRDTLLYQAGRASVPSPARWKALAAALALGQVLTLLVLLPQTTVRPPAPTMPPPPGITPAPGQPVETLTLHRGRISDTSDIPSVASEANLVPDDPPLRVYMAWSTMALD